MREATTRDRIVALMEELVKHAPRRGAYRVYLVGGGTAVYRGWRASSIDVDLYSADGVVFKDIQAIKERLNINIEFARPEDFVPPLRGSSGRHVLIETRATISFYHYDPYAQVFSKVVRGFERDLDDARQFVSHGMVDPQKLKSLVEAVPDSAYARYPNLTRTAVEAAIDDFVR